jgi:hypothetical protein
MEYAEIAYGTNVRQPEVVTLGKSARTASSVWLTRSQTRKAARGMFRASKACMISLHPRGGALHERPARTCDCAAELNLQRNPRQRFDGRGIFGLLGNFIVKFPISHSICFHVSTLQGGHAFNKYIFKPRQYRGRSLAVWPVRSQSSSSRLNSS